MFRKMIVLNPSYKYVGSDFVKGPRMVQVNVRSNDGVRPSDGGQSFVCNIKIGGWVGQSGVGETGWTETGGEQAT